MLASLAQAPTVANSNENDIAVHTLLIIHRFFFAQE